MLGPAFDLGRFPATAGLFADLRNEDSVAAKLHGAEVSLPPARPGLEARVIFPEAA